MKPISILSATLLCAATCMSLTQCAGESSNVINVDVNGSDAYIRLAFSVESTRSGESDPETDLKVIDVYVFDENETLETIKTGYKQNDAIETTSGYKTIYAVAGMKPGGGFDSTEPAENTTTVEAFEKLVLKSTSDYLINDNGYLMIGKSGPTQIIKSTEDIIPSTNIVPICMVRAMAKASLSVPEDLEGQQLKFSDPKFCVCQTSDIMPVAELAASMDHEADRSATYTNFTNPFDEYNHLLFESPVKSGNVKNYLYMAENISTTHVSGNTTFVAISLKGTPQKVYDYSSGDAPSVKTIDNSESISDFYAVGIEAPELGTVEYVVDANGDPYYFTEDGAASKYAQKLNGNTRAEDSGTYKVITFTNGRVYYKVNFNTPSGMPADYGSYSVLRNHNYTISVTSVNKLGASSESLLFPENPETPSDITGAYLNATFTVADWKDEVQNTELQ